MINFFRKIRQSLLTEGKTQKYLKYAVGEIVLVVIGILIALQINTWNEARLNAKKETVILENLHNEFIANKSQLDTVIFYHKMTLDNCNKIISKFPIDIEKVDLDTLSFYLGRTFTAYTFNPLQASVTSLINTSTFEIITNRKLRELLISWNDLVKDYQEEENYAKAYQLNTYISYFNKNFDYQFNLRDKRTNLEILKSFEFENMINERKGHVKEIVEVSGELQTLYHSIDEIIKLTSPKESFR